MSTKEWAIIVYRDEEDNAAVDQRTVFVRGSRAEAIAAARRELSEPWETMAELIPGQHVTEWIDGAPLTEWQDDDRGTHWHLGATWAEPI